MSPIVKRKGERFTLPGKYLLFILTIICCTLIAVTFASDIFNGPLNFAVSYIVVPYERGVSAIGMRLSQRKDELISIRELLTENEELKAEIERLQDENTRLMQDKYELNNLRTLFDLDSEYESYKKTGARVIYQDAGNWFSSFIIDKGYDDGIMLDMNVIAGNGLVGRITMVGPNWSRVTGIISDNSNVSVTIVSTQDNAIVTGDLSAISNGFIPFSQLIDSDNNVSVGDKIVTSDISDKYLPGILVGFVSEINNDPNNLTKSGYLLPVVDFEHIEEVLVITDMKQQITKEDMNKAKNADSQ